MADEPTGNLDTRTSCEVIELFRRLNREIELTVILVTHDLEVARSAERGILLRDGQVICDTQSVEQAATALATSPLP